MRLVVLRVENDDAAEDVARLVAAVLALNGYGVGKPYVIDPDQLHADAESDTPTLRSR